MAMKVKREPQRIVPSKVITRKGGIDTTGFPPGRIIGQFMWVREHKEKAKVAPVIPPTRVNQRTGLGSPS
jgi:hypothetical protein